MLAEVVYRTTLSESSWMINRGNMKIGSGCKYNNLYPLMAINPEGIVNVAESPDSNLWHGRLGHMSQVKLDWLMVINYIPNSGQRWTSARIVVMGNIPEVRTLHYEMVRQPLELVHTDICGPMPERSLGGSRYFITFIDDCTRKVWAYSIRSKEETLEVFSQWLAEVENRSGHRVKTLRSDNRGEYTSRALKQYLSEKRNPTSKDRSLYPHWREREPKWM